MTSSFPGTLNVLILKSLTWGPLHGYAISRWVWELTEEVLRVEEGVLYPALHRLEKEGCLEPSGGEMTPAAVPSSTL